jgi:uncharacterized RDD family membrane protein YckC
VSIIQVNTSFNINLQFDIAPFHIRSFAWIIDFVILYIFHQAVSLLYSEFFGAGENVGFYEFFILLPYLCYHLFFELLNNGQSLGKMTLGIKVVSTDGQEASTAQKLTRWLCRFPDFGLYWGLIIMIQTQMNMILLPVLLMITSIISFILFIASKYQQRLGDLAAGTVVIYKRLPFDINDTIFRQVQETNYQVSFPSVMKLSDNDINIINNVVTRHRKSSMDNYVSSIAAKIKTALDLNPDMDDDIFLDILLKDYNYLTQKK